MLNELVNKFIRTPVLTKPARQHGDIIAVAIWDSRYSFGFDYDEEVLEFVKSENYSPYSVIIYSDNRTRFVNEHGKLIGTKDAEKYIFAMSSNISVRDYVLSYRGVEFLRIAKMDSMFSVQILDEFLFAEIMGEERYYDDIYEGSILCFIFHLKEYKKLN